MDQIAINSLLERPKPNDELTLRAYRVIERWLEWARMHGHLEHAEGIVKDSRELIANAPADRQAKAGERDGL
jgi:hypothetical protein